MRDGNSTVFRHEQLRHRLADNIGFTYNHSMHPGQTAQALFEHH
jgi:hypothetical protein